MQLCDFGIGFASFVDLDTGNFCCGNPPSGHFPDVYSVFTHDNTSGLNWDEMTNSEREASAVNTGNVVWDGALTTSATPEEIVKWAKENMADYKYPRIVEFRDSLPMTATGKILKKELRDR